MRERELVAVCNSCEESFPAGSPHECRGASMIVHFGLGFSTDGSEELHRARKHLLEAARHLERVALYERCLPTRIEITYEPDSETNEGGWTMRSEPWA